MLPPSTIALSGSDCFDQTGDLKQHSNKVIHRFIMYSNADSPLIIQETTPGKHGIKSVMSCYVQILTKDQEMFSKCLQHLL